MSRADRSVDEADSLENVAELLTDVNAVRKALHVRGRLERVGNEDALRRTRDDRERGRAS